MKLRPLRRARGPGRELVLAGVAVEDLWHLRVAWRPN